MPNSARKRKKKVLKIGPEIERCVYIMKIFQENDFPMIIVLGFPDIYLSI
jgi:hypothetical protein